SGTAAVGFWFGSSGTTGGLSSLGARPAPRAQGRRMQGRRTIGRTPDTRKVVLRHVPPSGRPLPSIARWRAPSAFPQLGIAVDLRRKGRQSRCRAVEGACEGGV